MSLAKEFGATHVVNTSDAGLDLVETIRLLTDGFGSSITIDTTGNVGLIGNGMEFTGKRGQMILLGVAPLTAELPVHLISFMQASLS
jgi:Zn-dependent alcohol dehydrogenase